MRFVSLVATVAALVSTAQGAVPASCPGVAAARSPYSLASGWSAVKVVGGLTKPRGIVRDRNGRLLVVQSGVGISQHTVSANGCVGSSRTLITQSSLNHGIYFSPDGNTLYASSATTVWSWAYDTATGNVSGSPRVLVTGMNSPGHTTRTLAIPPNHPELLVVSLGSNGNLDAGSVSPTAARAIVKVFNLNSVPNGGHNFVTGGYNMGYGLRNEVGLAFDSGNMLWGVENSADSLTRTVNGQTTDVHIDNPAEELNYLGDPAVANNKWYGYPTCFTVGQPNVFRDRTFAIGDQFVTAPNATFNDTTCTQRSTASRLNFVAHSAPLDAKFDSGSANLYVTFHGSWNRQPPTGYKLVQVPFRRDSSGAYTPVAAANTLNGYSDIFFPPDVNRCSSACARPVGIVFDDSGRMYMTSDASPEGEVFLIGRT